MTRHRKRKLKVNNETKNGNDFTETIETNDTNVEKDVVDMTNKKSMSKLVKIGLGTLASLVVLGGVVGYSYSQWESEKDALVVYAKENVTVMDVLDYNQDNKFFKRGLSLSDINKGISKYKVNVKKLEDEYQATKENPFTKIFNVTSDNKQLDKQIKDAKDALTKAEAKFKIVEKASALFEKEYVLSDVREDYEKPDYQYEGLEKNIIALEDEIQKQNDVLKQDHFELVFNGEFETSYKHVLTHAHDALDTSKDATKLVSELIKDNKVISTNKSKFEKANTSVQKVKIPKVKEDLQKQMKVVRTEIDKEEKIAFEKKEKERLKQEQAEQQAIEEQKQQEQQASVQATTSESPNVQTNTTETPQATVQAQELVQESAPVETRTDGFNFNGYHFDIAGFGGGGGDMVPANTNNIFSWNQMPNHYLVEKVSPAGNAIWSLGVGSQIVINGNTYTIYKVAGGLDNQSGEAADVLYSEGAPISIQTCDTYDSWSTLTLWFAH